MLEVQLSGRKRITPHFILWQVVLSCLVFACVTNYPEFHHRGPRGCGQGPTRTAWRRGLISENVAVKVG